MSFATYNAPSTRYCSHRGGGHFDRQGNMVCGDCGRVAEFAVAPAESPRFDAEEA